MKKLMIVGLVAIMGGCATAPKYNKQTNDELCQELGRSVAAGEKEIETAILKELKTREGDMNRCQVEFEKGAAKHFGKSKV